MSINDFMCLLACSAALLTVYKFLIDACSNFNKELGENIESKSLSFVNSIQ